MTESIASASVALALMIEALGLLDGPEHVEAAARLREAIEALSAKEMRPRPIGGAEGAEVRRGLTSSQ
jgi:hypothetical protein